MQTGDVLALVGELGAGKTQLVRGLALGMGAASSAVASPTYVMVHEYPTAAGKPSLVHIDAYRLRSLEDLESIGWDASGSAEMRRDAVVAIEWADRLGDLAGPDQLQIALEHAGDSHRTLTVTPTGQWNARAADLFESLDKVARSRGRKCPICNGPASLDSPYLPFCSKRCKTIDLGKWISGDYVISRPVEEQDLDEDD